ncbi:hypothetical protein IAE37_001298 [Pseudomonas sp. S31]|uniref:hypothetical protein n=1 Tax=Pseudomonas sp. S31 TaxID=1564473 RepID=UPI0019114B39|nr:hypothetical protein [Pseudomonas sp. S31]MBK4999022.1 hypothetical protein [Pseudomonas sp. S31]
MSLIDEIREYVNRSHAYAWRAAHPIAPDEPGLVSALLCREMYQGLRDVLSRNIPPSTKLMVKGVFTHQTPKVKAVTGAKAVEIGDLLLIQQHFDTDPAKPSTGRALLLQAKTSLKPKTGSLNSGTQRIQFELYQSWPAFTGETRLATSPAGYSSWDFTHPSAGSEPCTAGAEYAIIYKKHAYRSVLTTPRWKGVLSAGPDHAALLAHSFSSESTWVTGPCSLPPAHARGGVRCPMDFACTLSGLLAGTVGRSFSPGVKSGGDHWSIFINEMLEVASNPSGDYLYTNANQGVISGMRGRDLLMQAAAPILRFAVAEDMEQWISFGHSKPGNYFEFTNLLLSTVTGSGRYDNEPPNEESSRQKFQPGHVPVLVIATIGDEPLQDW